MDRAGRDNAAEWALDVAAALTFALAAGFAGWALDARPLHAALAGPAFLLAYGFLGQWPRDGRSYRLPAFELAPVIVAAQPSEAFGELLLQADQILAPCPGEASPGEAELLLDDPLVGIGPGSRVVRLFGADRAPRRGAPSESQLPDSSNALVEALAELRRSLH